MDDYLPFSPCLSSELMNSGVLDGDLFCSGAKVMRFLRDAFDEGFSWVLSILIMIDSSPSKSSGSE